MLTLKKQKKQFLIILSVFILSISLSACSDSSVPGDTNQNQQPADTPNETLPKPGEESENKPEQQQQQLVEIMDLAKQGKISGCQFVAGKTVFDEVEKKWGTPDKTDWVAAAKGTYATYSSQGVVFGLNKGYQVFEIRAMGNDIKKITVFQVKAVLGNPQKSLKYPGQDILGYTAGTEYKLEFVFPEATANQPDPKLDHLNVLYPRGTVNMMADDPGRQW